jgi:hypothetical protein
MLGGRKLFGARASTSSQATGAGSWPERSTSAVSKPSPQSIVASESPELARMTSSPAAAD